MKKRTIIGIICMVLAVATTFLVAPVVHKRYLNGNSSCKGYKTRDFYY